MKYKIYNKVRFLRSDEAVIDQEGNVLILDDGDVPNHIRNCLDVDILKATEKTDIKRKDIIEGDILLSENDVHIVDYCGDAFVIVDLTQQNDGSVFYQHRLFASTFDWMKGKVERVGNIYENKQMKKFYRSVVDNSWQRT